MHLMFDKRVMSMITVVIVAIIITIVWFYRKYPDEKDRIQHKSRLWKLIGVFVLLGFGFYIGAVTFDHYAVVVTDAPKQESFVMASASADGTSEDASRQEYGIGALFRGARDMRRDSKESAAQLKAFKAANPNADKEQVKQAARAIKADQTDAKYAGKKAAYDARKAATEKNAKSGALANLGK